MLKRSVHFKCCLQLSLSAPVFEHPLHNVFKTVAFKEVSFYYRIRVFVCNQRIIELRICAFTMKHCECHIILPGDKSMSVQCDLRIHERASSLRSFMLCGIPTLAPVFVYAFCVLGRLCSGHSVVAAS